MKRLIAAILSGTIILTMITPYTAFAETYIDSIGSAESDIQHIGDGEPIHSGTVNEKSEGVIGYDETQGKESEYVRYNNSSVQQTITTDIYATLKDGTVKVSYPTILVLNGRKSNGYNTAEGKIMVKGDISDNLIINITPQDEDNQKSGINFTLSQDDKADITASVEQEYITFVSSSSTVSGANVNKYVTSEFNDNSSALVTIKTNEATAGPWSGTYNTLIELTYA